MKLGFNIDHYATIRQARMSNEPDPVYAALTAEIAGCHGITAHLREDRRHIQDRDIKLLKTMIKTKLNMEMAITKEMEEIACEIKPYMCTLVPEKRQELTTEGGLDIIKNKMRLLEIIPKLQKNGIIVSLFIDPDKDQIEVSKEVAAEFVELHTGSFSEAKNEEQYKFELNRIHKAVSECIKNKLRINAGHGLDYRNIEDIAKIKEIEELNIGFSIVARSSIVGVEKAIKEMLFLINRYSSK